LDADVEKLTEEPLHLGEGGRVFGILTRPRSAVASDTSRTVFVFLSAGLLHRVGPSRLHVRLARELASLGFSSLRVDFAGKGDSVAADFSDIQEGIRSHLGESKLVIAGLCSGADNAIRLAITNDNVLGMILLDPHCSRDSGFASRQLVSRALNPRRILSRAKRLLTKLDAPLTVYDEDNDANPFLLRDLPTLEQTRDAFNAIRSRGGAVLSVFTQYALGYYNSRGQLAKVLAVPEYSQYCTEEYWPDAEHTYKMEIHRQKLINRILRWIKASSIPTAQAKGAAS
jgi:hypothetical protein